MKNTTQEKIKVMQAYIDGKTIQCKDKMINDDEWDDVVGNERVSWDWFSNDYRIKPEKKILPYKDAKEFIQAQKEHGLYLKAKGENLYSIPLSIHDRCIKTTYYMYDYQEAANCFEWQDGTPCGIIEE